MTEHKINAIGVQYDPLNYVTYTRRAHLANSESFKQYFYSLIFFNRMLEKDVGESLSLKDYGFHRMVDRYLFPLDITEAYFRINLILADVAGQTGIKFEELEKLDLTQSSEQKQKVVEILEN